MKCNFEIYLKNILITLILNIVIQPIWSKTLCKDPSDYYLERLLSEYNNYFFKYEQNTFKKIQNKFFSSFNYNNNDDYDYNYDSSTSKEIDNVYSTDTIRTHTDNSQCFKHLRNRTVLNQKSMCPWKYVILKRNDIFPKMIVHVKCTCERCSSGHSKNFFNKYKCFPLFKNLPILRKGQCGTDGYYEWRPDTEKINIACICATQARFIPHL